MPEKSRPERDRGVAKESTFLVWTTGSTSLRTFTFSRGGSAGPPDNLLWSPDGKALATTKAADRVKNKRESGAGFIQLWDPATGKELRSIAIPDIRATSQARLVFSPDSKMLAV